MTSGDVMKRMKNAVFAARINAVTPQKQSHFVGLPPGIAAGESPAPMKDADLLMLEPDDDGVFLIRYANAEFAGDTWHDTADDAKAQAEFEYAVQPHDWIEIPQDVLDDRLPADCIAQVIDFLAGSNPIR